jgi:hypothetical protein
MPSFSTVSLRSSVAVNSFSRLSADSLINTSKFSLLHFVYSAKASINLVNLSEISVSLSDISPYLSSICLKFSSVLLANSLSSSRYSLNSLR